MGRLDTFSGFHIEGVDGAVFCRLLETGWEMAAHVPVQVEHTHPAIGAMVGFAGGTAGGHRVLPGRSCRC